MPASRCQRSVLPGGYVPGIPAQEAFPQITPAALAPVLPFHDCSDPILLKKAPVQFPHCLQFSGSAHFFPESHWCVQLPLVLKENPRIPVSLFLKSSALFSDLCSVIPGLYFSSDCGQYFLIPCFLQPEALFLFPVSAPLPAFHGEFPEKDLLPRRKKPGVSLFPLYEKRCTKRRVLLRYSGKPAVPSMTLFFPRQTNLRLNKLRRRIFRFPAFLFLYVRKAVLFVSFQRVPEQKQTLQVFPLFPAPDGPQKPLGSSLFPSAPGERYRKLPHRPPALWQTLLHAWQGERLRPGHFPPSASEGTQKEIYAASENPCRRSLWLL